MGLLDKLTGQGSTLSKYGGATPSINPLALKSSNLQGNYSLDGSDASIVAAAYAQYEDGVLNPIPQPSQLDLNGATPPKYLDNPPR
jgi:hypothetical protein